MIAAIVLSRTQLTRFLVSIRLLTCLLVSAAIDSCDIRLLHLRRERERDCISMETALQLRILEAVKPAYSVSQDVFSLAPTDHVSRRTCQDSRT
jgi:hypothetical protein